MGNVARRRIRPPADLEVAVADDGEAEHLPAQGGVAPYVGTLHVLDDVGATDDVEECSGGGDEARPGTAAGVGAGGQSRVALARRR
jgi:hypothetical protein